MINKETGSLEHNSHEALYHDNHKGQEGTEETASVTGIYRRELPGFSLMHAYNDGRSFRTEILCFDFFLHFSKLLYSV